MDVCFEIAGSTAHRDLERDVRGASKLEGSSKSPDGCFFAVRTTTHVHNLAGNRNCLLGSAPFDWPSVVGTHGFEDHLVAVVAAVGPVASAGSPEGPEDAAIKLGSFADPFAIGVRKSFGEVEPSPHHNSGADREKASICEFGGKGVYPLPGLAFAMGGAWGGFPLRP